MKPKIILDTDIGDDIDDSFALILGVLSGKADLIGVTTCFRDTIRRAKIAKALLKSMGSDIEVYAGEGWPINQEMVYAEFDRFDETGKVIMSHYCHEFDNEPISPIHAVDYILETLDRYPDQITIVSIGPMTNLARAYLRSQDSFRKAKGILFMGGHTKSEFKEWNVRCDVEAADLVFRSGVPMRIVGIDVTSQCKFDKKDVHRIEALDDIGFGPLLKKMTKAYMDHFDGKRLPVMHDPLTLSCLTEDFCRFESVRVDVGLNGFERGQTMVNPNSSNRLIEVATDVDVGRFMRHLFEVLDGKPSL